MSSISRIDWLVLKEASRSRSGIQPFTVHRRLAVTAIQLATSVRVLESRGLVGLDARNESIKVTDKGLLLLQRSLEFADASDRGVLHGEGADRKWFEGPKLSINSPYVPRLKLL